MTKTYIICGPLGSGKTTTLNEILKTVPSNLKVGIIINDAGYIGTDSQRVLPGYETGSMPGCICCESSGNLSMLLEQKKKKYDVVFIEGTGGANAANLVEEVLRHSKQYTISGVIAVVPVEHYPVVSQTVSFNTAIDIANIVRLTWSSEKIDPALNQKLTGKKLFSQTLTYDDLKGEQWIFDVADEHKEHSSHHGHHHEHDDHHHHAPHDNLKASVIPIARNVTAEQMIASLDHLRRAQVERAKGFLPDGRTFDVVHGEISYSESPSGGLPYLMIISSKGEVDKALLKKFNGIKAPAIQQAKFFSSNISFENACRTFEYAHRKAKAEHYVQKGLKVTTEFEGADTAFMMGLEMLHNFKDSKALTIAMDDYVRIRSEGIRNVEKNLRLFQRSFMGATLASYAVLTIATDGNGAYPYKDKNATFLGKYISDETKDIVISKVVPSFVQFISEFSKEQIMLTAKTKTDEYFADVANIAKKHADQDTKGKLQKIGKKLTESYSKISAEKSAKLWLEICG